MPIGDTLLTHNARARLQLLLEHANVSPRCAQQQLRLGRSLPRSLQLALHHSTRPRRAHTERLAGVVVSLSALHWHCTGTASLPHCHTARAAEPVPATCLSVSLAQQASRRARPCACRQCSGATRRRESQPESWAAGRRLRALGQPQGAQPCAAVHAQRLNATALEPPPWLRGHIHTTQLKRHSMISGKPG